MLVSLLFLVTVLPPSSNVFGKNISLLGASELPKCGPEPAYYYFLACLVFDCKLPSISGLMLAASLRSAGWRFAPRAAASPPERRFAPLDDGGVHRRSPYMETKWKLAYNNVPFLDFRLDRSGITARNMSLLAKHKDPRNK